MTNQPSVTVIIPFKNNINYLFSAIGSVFNQSYKNLKLNIIYDNQDRTDLYKIKKFIKNEYKKKSKLVKIEVNKSNLGAGYSRNVGIKKCNSNILLFWIWMIFGKEINFNFKLNTWRKITSFSHTSYCIINKSNKIISSRVAKSKIKFEELIESCDIGLSTVVLNTNFIKKITFIFQELRRRKILCFG